MGLFTRFSRISRQRKLRLFYERMKPHAQTKILDVGAQVALEIGFKAGLAIPILARKEVVAVMVFFVFEEREEDKQLINLISSVAS